MQHIHADDKVYAWRSRKIIPARSRVAAPDPAGIIAQHCVEPTAFGRTIARGEEIALKEDGLVREIALMRGIQIG